MFFPLWYTFFENISERIFYKPLCCRINDCRGGKSVENMWNNCLKPLYKGIPSQLDYFFNRFEHIFHLKNQDNPLLCMAR